MHKIIWKGTRTPFQEKNKVVMNIDGGEFWGNLPLYLDEVNHSPDGFEWGFGGSGPAQLSYAILRSYFTFAEKMSIDEAIAQAHKFSYHFKEDFVSKWKNDEWEINSNMIWVWVGGEKAGWV